jgi:hypothetical protein
VYSLVEFLVGVTAAVDLATVIGYTLYISGSVDQRMFSSSHGYCKRKAREINRCKVSKNEVAVRDKTKAE